MSTAPTPDTCHPLTPPHPTHPLCPHLMHAPLRPPCPLCPHLMHALPRTPSSHTPTAPMPNACTPTLARQTHPSSSSTRSMGTLCEVTRTTSTAPAPAATRSARPPMLLVCFCFLTSQFCLHAHTCTRLPCTAMGTPALPFCPHSRPCSHSCTLLVQHT